MKRFSMLILAVCLAACGDDSGGTTPDSGHSIDGALTTIDGAMSIDARVVDASADAAMCTLIPPAGCCFTGASCGARRCIRSGACAAGQAGTCAGTVTPPMCWTDDDCTGGQTCMGASVCPCGAACIIADHPGTCG